jgi:hypothetical protein
LEQVAKLLVQRQRPGTTVPDAILRGVPHAGLSFTSGHAIITFAIAGLLVLVLPRGWGILAFVLADCNGLARVYDADPHREGRDPGSGAAVVAEHRRQLVDGPRAGTDLVFAEPAQGLQLAQAGVGRFESAQLVPVGAGGGSYALLMRTGRELTALAHPVRFARRWRTPRRRGSRPGR